MSVANLQEVKRYDWEVEDNHYYCTDSVDGEWCKFEEAVEASSNSIQQLKAEIAAVLDQLKVYQPHLYSFLEAGYINKLRQLSAV